jgi:uncharacterized membrane protein
MHEPLNNRDSNTTTDASEPVPPTVAPAEHSPQENTPAQGDLAAMEVAAITKASSAGLWLRNKFLTGLFVALPVVGTLWVLNLLYLLVNSRFEPVVITFVTSFRDDWAWLHWITVETFRDNEKVYTVPGAGFILTVAFLVGLGMFVSNYAGKKALGCLEKGLLRVPLVSQIYNGAKQVVESVQMLGHSDKLQFSQVVLIPYPGIPGKLLGFVTCQFTDTNGQQILSVFLPTAPNPITGFVIVLPRADAEFSDLSIEDATKMVVSGGLVSPKKFTFPSQNALTKTGF